MKKVLVSIDWSENAEKAFDCKCTINSYNILFYRYFLFQAQETLQTSHVRRRGTCVRPNLVRGPEVDRSIEGLGLKVVKLTFVEWVPNFRVKPPFIRQHQKREVCAIVLT